MLERNGVENFTHLVQMLPDVGSPAHRLGNRIPERPESGRDLREHAAPQYDDFHVCSRPYTGRALAAVNQSSLAEEVARAQNGDNLGAAVVSRTAENLYLAMVENIKVSSRLAGAENVVTGRVVSPTDAPGTVCLQVSERAGKHEIACPFNAHLDLLHERGQLHQVDTTPEKPGRKPGDPTAENFGYSALPTYRAKRAHHP